MSFDPFAPYQAQARSYLYYTASASDIQLYRDQLVAITVLYGLLAFISVTALVMRYRASPGFWLFKVVSTSGADGLRSDGGTYILPHAVNMWLVTSFVFCVLMQPYIEYARRYANPPATLRGELGWRCAIWIPLFVGGWQLVHATAIAPIIAQKPSLFDASHCRPWIVNTFFVSTPLIVIACLLPFIISASNAFNVAVDIFTQLDTGLTSASAAAAQGVLLNPAHLLDLANQANAAIPLVITTFQRVWLGWSIAACFLFPVFLYAFVAHCIGLSSTLRGLRKKKNQSASAVSQSDTNALRSYMSFFFTMITALLLSVSYAVFAIIVTIVSRDFFNPGGNIAATSTLASMWIFAILGAIANIGILLRSSASSTTSSQSQSRKTPTSTLTVPLTFVPRFATNTPQTSTMGEEEKGGSEAFEMELSGAHAV